MISLIVAMDKNRAIGKHGGLPWYLPADLKKFKDITYGHPIIMGRKTFDSIGRALPGRTNIVVTRNDDWNVSGVSRVSSLEEAFRIATETDALFNASFPHGCEQENRTSVSAPSSEVFVIGGGEIFREAIGRADKLYVTEVQTEVPGSDVFFPEISREVWVEATREHHEHDEKNIFDYDSVVYETHRLPSIKLRTSRSGQGR